MKRIPLSAPRLYIDGKPIGCVDVTSFAVREKADGTAEANAGGEVPEEVYDLASNASIDRALTSIDVMCVIPIDTAPSFDDFADAFKRADAIEEFARSTETYAFRNVAERRYATVDRVSVYDDAASPWTVQLARGRVAKESLVTDGPIEARNRVEALEMAKAFVEDGVVPVAKEKA